MPDVTFPGGAVMPIEGWQQTFGRPGLVTLTMVPVPATGAEYNDRMIALHQIAYERDMRFVPTGQGDVPFGDAPTYTEWALDPDTPYWQMEANVRNFACYWCGRSYYGGDRCPHCTANQVCPECGVSGCPVSYDHSSGLYLCTNCLTLCVVCDDRTGWYSDGHCQRCWEERVTCENCGASADETSDQYVGGMLVCDECYNQRCRNCGDNFQEYGDYCYRCEDEMADEQLDYDESFDYGIEDFTPLEFSFDRGRQRTSVEIEFSGDPEGVAAELHRQDLSPVRAVGDYHSGMGRENNQCAYVEYDGSISHGGELIISRLDLPEQEETRRLWQTLAVLRSRVRSGDNSLNMQCGVHIHVDVGRYDLPWVMTSAVVYNFLERVLYHIASANWSSHRSTRGNDYSKLTPKMIDNPRRFDEVFGYDRYYGLNASNYLTSTRRCECGNGATMSRCQCRRYKSTLEFRLWNTTVNPRKLHAYIAICQAITAFGRGKSLTVSDLPAWEFDRREKPGPEDAAEYARRLVWMFENLPFSPEERNSIRYCLRHCDLAKVLENSDVDSNTVHGILHNDELLSIPEFIAPREDEDQIAGRVTIPANTVPAFRITGEPVRIDANGRWHDAQGRFTPAPTWMEQAMQALNTYFPQVYVPADVAAEAPVAIDF